jgi:hypothetical protein
MPALVAGIHALRLRVASKAWMTSPAMTERLYQPIPSRFGLSAHISLRVSQ